MNKRILFLLLSLLSLLLSFPVSAQTIKCNTKSVKIPMFNNYIGNPFENQFVNNNVLQNIKKSTYNFEVRLYTIGNISTYGDLILVQSDGVTMLVTTKKVFFEKKMFGPGRTPVYNDGKISAHEISLTREIATDCNFIKNLIKNNLFTLMSSTYNEFNLIGGVRPSMDIQAQYTFEIKADTYFRTFQYTDIYGYQDTVEGRREKMDQIFEQIKKL